MKTIRSILAVTLAGLLLVPNAAHPEDIDLYSSASSSGDANVLIVLDNASIWAATGYSGPAAADADAAPDRRTPAMSETLAEHEGKIRSGARHREGVSDHDGQKFRPIIHSTTDFRVGTDETQPLLSS